MKRLSIRSLLVGLAILVLVGVGLGPGQARGAPVSIAPLAVSDTLILNPKQDTYIDESDPGAVHPTENVLVVGRRSTQVGDADLHALLYFNLADLPADAELVSASLALYQVDASGADAYNIWPEMATEAWDETTVSWKIRPPMTEVDPSLSVDLKEGWKTFNVTGAVKAWIGGANPNYGFVLHGDARTLGVHPFSSSVTNTPPTLTIEYRRSATSTPTPTDTPVSYPGPTATRTATTAPTRTPTRAPTRTPLPTWTPVPTRTPTPGPTATPTPQLALMPYFPVQAILAPNLFQGDVSIYGIEITQGIQCFNTSQGLAGCSDNSLPLVVKKDTTARVYLRYGGLLSSMSNVPVRLHILANGVEYVVNGSGRAWSNLDQGRDDNANFYFNVNFSNTVNVQFWAEVDPNNTVSETNEGNNRFPASGTISLNFRPRDTLKIVGQRTRYHPSGYTGDQYAGGWAVNGGAADWFEQVLPIRNNGINYSVASGYLDWTTSLGSGDGQHALIQNLNNRWILQNAFSFLFGSTFKGADHVYGWVDNQGYSGGHADMPVYPHAGGLGVVGIGTDRPGTSTDDPGGGALIFGHELIHDYDVLHTNTADSCGSSDGNSTFPYGSSSIQEFGFNPITGRIYNPSNTHDVMSYCPAGGSRNGWVSPFTWSTMFNRLAPSISAYAAESKVVAGAQEAQEPNMTGVLHATSAARSLVINATIYNPNHAEYNPAMPGALGDLHLVETGVAVSLPTGDYAVELRSGATVLASHPFTITFESEYDAHGGGDDPVHAAGEPPFPAEDTVSAGVALIVPWEEGATSVALVRGQTLLDQRAVSAHAPTVAFTAPATTTTWLDGATETLTWTAADQDGDTLSFSVFYSADGGTEWTLITTGLTTPSLAVEVDALAGSSDARFRVVATDGLNMAWAETPFPIAVPNKAPDVLIMDPQDGAVFEPGGLVVLLGAATDLEDGSLPDEAMHWEDDRQGSLGVGPSVALNTLEPGPHVITFSVTDQLGIAGSATVHLFVGHQIYLPLNLK